MNKMLTLTIVAMSMLFMSCNRMFHAHESDASSFSTKDMALVETNSGIRMPPGSRGLNLYVDGSLDEAFVSKIEIPAAASKAMVSSVQSLPNEEISVVNPLYSKVNWWLPRRDTIQVERHYVRRTDVVYIHVIVSDEGGRWFVYVCWSPV